MTRTTGKKVLRTTCCGSFVCTTAYGSINLMAHEHWTDGRKVGGLMSQDGGLRECLCGSFYLIGDCEKVMTIPKPKPIAPKGWESIKSSWWTKLLGKPTKADILLHYDTRPVHEIEAEQMRIPEARYVSDNLVPEIFKQENVNNYLMIVARRRYWRYLNDPFRCVYREHRKIHGESFPNYQLSIDQAKNIISLIELLQISSSPNFIEIAELYRELGEFRAAAEAHLKYRGRQSTLGMVIKELIRLSVSAPVRFRL